jgi:hypothetical protein
MRRFLLAAVLSSSFVACVEEAAPSRTGLADPAGVAAGDTAPLALPAQVVAPSDRFTTSTACALCHSNSASATAMRDAAGEPIAPFNLWQGTMMANAARDPFWRAMVTAEIAATPSAKAAIEAKCMRCHAPMASEAAHAQGLEPTLDDLHNAGAFTQLAVDGVSCTVCHQIKPDNLGTEASFTGGFEIGSERKIFGPHQNPATGPMQNHVNYTPTFADHVTKSILCATCHTLDTHALGDDGAALDAPVFSEQATYLEWRNSRFNDESDGDGASCQACHMPVTDDEGEIIKTRIARSPPGGDFNINVRDPFGRHVFAGANTFMPRLMKNERDTLKPQATDAAFDATVALAEHRLSALTARVALGEIIQDGDTLRFPVTITSDTGHKLPTGFPSRRAWLEVVVVDEDGSTIFASGLVNGEGRLTDDLGDVLDIEKAGGPFEPHHDEITRSDEVQIYESVMSDIDGKRAARLLKATGYLKDNRILPAGYSTSHPTHKTTASVGVDGDDDFIGGEDTVRYAVPLRGLRAARVEVRFLYQSVSARIARDLFQVDTPEVKAFRTMYERASHRPAVIASVARDL